MISESKKRKDAGAKDQKVKTVQPDVPLQLPDGTTANVYSSTKLRKKLRKLRKKKRPTPPVEDG